MNNDQSQGAFSLRSQKREARSMLRRDMINNSWSDIGDEMAGAIGATVPPPVVIEIPQINEEEIRKKIQEQVWAEITPQIENERNNIELERSYIAQQTQEIEQWKLYLESREQQMGEAAKTASLALRSDQSIIIGDVVITSLGIEESQNITYEEWQAFGQLWGQMNNRLQWIIGDWINHANNQWGEKYDEACRLTGLKEGTLRDYAWVARSVPYHVRNENIVLKFEHFKKIASIEDPREQNRLLAMVKQNEWSARQFDQYLKGQDDDDNDKNGVVPEMVKPIFKSLKSIKGKSRAIKKIINKNSAYINNMDPNMKKYLANMIDQEIKTLKELKNQVI